jgi:hypothetical protein
MKGGALTAPSSRINLASAASPGEVVPTATDLEVTSETLGRIEISSGASVNASGAPFPGDGAGGTVVIRAGELMVADRPTPFDPTILTDTSGFVNGAETGIDVKVTGEMSVTRGAELRSAAFASGNAGDIALDVGRLTITDGALINSSTSFFAVGAGGDIIVNAREGVSVIDAQITSQTAFAMGDGGRISITAPEVELQGGFNATVNSSTSGGGFLGGNAGDIVLEVDRLTIGDDAGIDSTTENSLGDAGNIFIYATEEVLLSSPNSIFGAVIRTSNLTGPGEAGNIVVETPRLTLTDRGSMTSTTDGPGKGGSIIVKPPDGGGMSSNEVVISGPGSGLFTDTTADGASGEIDITARKVVLTDGGTVSAKATGAGDAGNLTIALGSFTSQNSSLSTEAEMSDGGNIELTATGVVDLFKSTITAEAMGPAQSGSDGGNVAILANDVALNKSAVLANAFGGDGGNIDIVAKVFLASTDSIVDASSELGIDGEVNVDAGVRVLTGTLAPLPDVFLSGVDLLRDRCAARHREGRTSSFILGGRDRVPTEPGDSLPSPQYPKKPYSSGHGLELQKRLDTISLTPASIFLSQLDDSTEPRLQEFFLGQKCRRSDYRRSFIYRKVLSTAKAS